MEHVLFKKQTRNGHQSPFRRYLSPAEEVVANFSRSILFKKTSESQKVNSSVFDDCEDRKIGMITTIKNFNSSTEEVENLLKTFGYQQKYRAQRKNEVHCIYRKVTRGR
jgi:hypothetical protein